MVWFVEDLLELLAAFGDRKPAVVIDAIGSSEFEASLSRGNGRPSGGGPWPGVMDPHCADFVSKLSQVAWCVPGPTIGQR